MKLLLDENLSRRLVPFLQAAFPDTTQVTLIGLESASDAAIWQFARENSFVIATRDSDFAELAVRHGRPPAIILIRGDNRSKSAVLNLLLANRDNIVESLTQAEISCIELDS